MNFGFRIDVCGKNAELVLQSRVDGFSKDMLYKLLYLDRKLIDYFDKNMSIFSMDDFNLSNYNTAHVVYKPKNMTAEELYNGYLWIYKEVYSFKNIMKRLPKFNKQWIPFLAFNFFYRNFGRLTELLCNIVSFKNIGRFFRWLAYGIK